MGSNELLLQEIARLRDGLASRVSPVDATVETVNPLVLRLADGSVLHGAVAIGIRPRPTQQVTVLIGNGRALALPYVAEGDPFPGELSAEDAGALAQLQVKVDQIESAELTNENALAGLQRTPEKVEGLIATTEPYTDAEGITQGRIKYTWIPVNTAVDDGSEISLKGYEIAARRAEMGAPWAVVRSSDTASGEYSPVAPGTEIVSRVRAVSAAGAPGEWSDEVVVISAGDTEPPPVPSDPILSQKLAVVSAKWDGLSSTGTTGVTDDFSHVEVAAGKTNTPVDIVARIAAPDDIATISGLDYAQYWFRYRSVDRSGNASEWSGTKTLTVQALVDADLIETTIQDQFDARDQAIATIQDEILPPLQTAMTDANRKLSEHTQEIQDQHNDLVALRQAALTGTTVEYAVGSSETVPPEDGWSTETPTRTPGSFIWVRTVVQRGETSTTTNPALLTGNTGAPGPKGDRGTDGLAGKDGVGLVGTSISYARGTSGTVAPTSGWQGNPPAAVKGQYLWTRTIWTYSDESTETGYSAAYWGTDGASGTDGIAGKDGVGIKSTTITYAQSTSGTTAPTSDWGSQPPTAAAGRYIWTRTVWTYTDGSTETGYSVGKIGNTGAKGDKGDKGADGVAGADGVGLTGTTISYAKSTSATNPPGSAAWGSNPPTPTKGQYLWTRTVWTYSDGSTETGYSTAYWATDGAKGDDGIAGKDGVGITGTDIKYAVNSSGTTAPLPSANWQATPPAASAGQFMWTRTIWTYSDNSTETGYSVGKIGNTGAKGDKGDTGANGSDGADGVSVVSVTTYYLRAASRPLHPSGNPPSGGWTEEEPGYLFGFALWRTEQVMLSNGDLSYTPPTLVGGDAALENAIEARREFVTYEWAGARHASESIEKMNGREVRRNYIKNPSFELSTAGWSSFGSVGEVVRSSSYQGQMWDPSQGGQGNAWVPYSNNGRADTHHVQWRAGSTAVNDCYLITAPADYVPVTPGEWVAVGGLVATEASDQYEIDIVVQFIGPTGSTVSSHSDYAPAKFYEGRLVRKVLQVPEGAETVRLVLWVRRSGGLPENSRSWADAIALYKAPSEAEAWAQLSLGYFDGDAPSGAGDERITNAQLSANRRNQIITALTGPFGSTHPETGEPLTKGDTWWQKDTLGPGGVVIGEWHWDGGWRSATIGHQVISSVDVNNLNVYDTAKMKTAVIDKLWADGLFAKTGLFNRAIISSTDNILPGADDLRSVSPTGSAPADVGFGDSRFGINSSDPSFWVKGSQGPETNIPFHLQAGTKYRVSVDSRSTVNNTRFYWQFVAQSGQDLTAGGGTSYVFSNALAGTGWSTHTTEYTPAESGLVTLKVYANHSNGASNPDGYQWFRNARIMPMTGAVHIENGAVTSDKVTADAGWFTKLSALSAEFNTAFANKITADTITSGSFSGQVFEGGTFTGSMFRTSASTQRVQMDSTGLKAFNSIGTTMFSLTGASGSIAGFTITGTTITGGTIRTAETGARIQMTGGLLQVVNSGGREIIKIAPDWQPPGSVPKQPALVFQANVSGSPARMAIYGGDIWFMNGGYVIGSLRNNPGLGMFLENTDSGTDTNIRNTGTTGNINIDAGSGGIYLSSNWHDFNIPGAASGYRTWAIRPISIGGVNRAILQFSGGGANMPQTTIAANVLIDSNGYFYRTSSARRFKNDIQDIGADPYRVLDVPVRDWVDATIATDDDSYRTRTPGVVAEEVEDVGLEQFVTYDEDGQTSGVLYDRLPLLLIPVVRDLRDRITRLEEQHG